MKQNCKRFQNRAAIPALLFCMSMLMPSTGVFGQTNWKCATNKAEFRRRADFQSVIFNNKMWVLNGTGSKLDPVRDTNIVSFHDTWYSTTGATWTRAADSVPYPIASMFAALVFNGFMWVVGGHQG